MKQNLIILCLTAVTTLSVNVQAESLLEIYQLAKKNDAGLKAAQATYQASKEEVQINKGSLLPSISFSGSLGYSDTEGPTSNTTAEVENTTVALSLDYPIYSSALNYAVDIVELDYKSAGISYKNTEENLTYEILEAYFDLLAQESDLNTARSHSKATESQLNRVKKQFSVGQIAITDVHTSQAEYDSTLVDILTAESNVMNAQDTLYQLTGKRIKKIPDLIKSYPITLEKDKNANYYVDIANKKNKDVQVLKIAYENARTNIDLVKSNGRSPTLSLAGSLSQSDDTSTPVSSSDGAITTSEISLNLSIPLYEGGSISASVRQAIANAEAVKEQLNNGLQDTELAIRKLYRALQTSVAKVAAQKQLIVSYSSLLKATQAGYDTGTRNIVELLDAQSDLFDAQGDLERLRYEFVLQKLSLLEFIGALNEEEVIKLGKWLKY